MEFPLLNEILVIFGLAITVLFICHRLKIPAIVGYLLTGILAGPHGLALVKSVEGVQSIAELGVIFLLFNIGLEFSFTKLLDIKKTALIGGTVQVGLSIVCTFIIARLLGISANQALFLGFLISLSSTAIVLKQMGERAELDTPQPFENSGYCGVQPLPDRRVFLYIIPNRNRKRAHKRRSLPRIFGSFRSNDDAYSFFDGSSFQDSRCHM